MIFLDFETHPIVDGSPTMPEPVSVAILATGVRKFLAWGHPSGNNCTRA